MRPIHQAYEPMYVVVTGEPTVATVVADRLRGAGICVDVAESAELAHACAPPTVPRAIVLCVTEPGLARPLRLSNAPPVVYVMGPRCARDEAALRRAGAQVVSAPVPVAHLVRCLEAVAEAPEVPLEPLHPLPTVVAHLEAIDSVDPARPVWPGELPSIGECHDRLVAAAQGRAALRGDAAEALARAWREFTQLEVSAIRASSGGHGQKLAVELVRPLVLAAAHRLRIRHALEAAQRMEAAGGGVDIDVDALVAWGRELDSLVRDVLPPARPGVLGPDRALHRDLTAIHAAFAELREELSSHAVNLQLDLAA